MKIWNDTEINKSILFLVVIACFLSCKDNGINQFENYYNIYDDTDIIKGYFKRVSSVNESTRTDTVYRYNKRKELNNTRVEKYTFDNNTLKNQKGVTILSIKEKDSCISYTDINDNESESCYLGVYKIDTYNKKDVDSYKFNQKELIIDGVTKIQFFDDNFILIKEEFKGGSIDYYRIERTDNINGLKN